MKVTRQITARKLQAYLKGRLETAELVAWMEQAMLDGDFAPADAPVLRKVVPRLGRGRRAGVRPRMDRLRATAATARFPCLRGCGCGLKKVSPVSRTAQGRILTAKGYGASKPPPTISSCCCEI